MNRHQVVNSIVGCVLIALLCACANGRSVEGRPATTPPSTTVSTTASPDLPRAVAPGAFTGRWLGHTRWLRVAGDGTGRERIDANCCQLVLDISFRITRVSHNHHRRWAAFTITEVRLGDSKFFSPTSPAPQGGQTGTLRLRHGVVTDSLTHGTYCNREAGNAGVCGL